jgi:hypothetical protein
MSFRNYLFIPLAALALNACADEEEVAVSTTTDIVELNDGGELCMFAQAPFLPGVSTVDPEMLTFDEGGRLHITVAMPNCLSQSCEVDREADCSITRDGEALTVQSRLAYRTVERESCTLECGRLIARCESEPLEAGNYTVHFDGQSHALPVPSTLSESCN